MGHYTATLVLYEGSHYQDGIEGVNRLRFIPGKLAASLTIGASAFVRGRSRKR